MCTKILKSLLQAFPYNSHSCRSMALLKQILNPMTGQNEWEPCSEDYDYHQEVANAGFGDMLHDWERNQKYYEALRRAISKMHEGGRKAHVLDIGTGTGILAMMAVRAGADTVTACEAFLPMANCAEKILKANGMCAEVRLIKKRSTDLKVGVDLPRKANLLVTEVLDTELIGEGAIGIYNHAHKVLLTDDVICIPARATCYAQVVQSSLAAQWNSMKMLASLDGDVLLKPPTDILQCKGEAALHDLQLSQLPLDQFRLITQATEIFEFDFSSKETHPTQRMHNLKLKAITGGTTDLVFYWWDIKMDVDGEIVLSCAPFWAHPELKRFATNKRNAQIPLANLVPWRDHWMQAIYYIPRPLHLSTADSEFMLNCNHDEYSLWFDVCTTDAPEKLDTPRHACSCSLHMTYSRTRIGQLNQSQRNKRYLLYLEEAKLENAHVLVLGDGCLLGLTTVKFGAASVICHEPHRFSRRFMESVSEQNEFKQVKFIEQLEALTVETLDQLTHIFAEPYFLTSILPWDNFYFGTLLDKIQQTAQIAPTVKIAPHSACIYVVPVEFLDLHKIRMPVGECESFDLTLFDKMVDTSASIAQSKIEAQPLWEYPCRALAQAHQVLGIVFRDFQREETNEGVISIESAGACNGIALWVDWHIDDSSNVVSTGPEFIAPGQFIKWNMFVRQGVHLIGKPLPVLAHRSSVKWSVDFKPTVGQLNFNFEVQA